MKKLCFLYAFFALVLIACDMRTSGLHLVDAIDSIKVERYDRIESRYLTTGDFSALQEMNTDYPTETRALIEDLLKIGSVNDININKQLLDFYQDSTLQNVIYAVEAEYADMSDIDKLLKESFGRLHKEMPQLPLPTFYAQIGAFDQSIVVDDRNIGISLDKYLGDDYPAYKHYYDKTQLASMKREYIVPDCMVFYLLSQFQLQKYEQRSQKERDMHMSIIMWVTNRMTKTNIFNAPYVKQVDEYMKSHPDVTIEKLLYMKRL